MSPGITGAPSVAYHGTINELDAPNSPCNDLVRPGISQSPHAECRNNVSNPFTWSVPTKWVVTLTACYVTLIVGLNSTAITAAAAPINQRYGVSDVNFPNSFWPVTAWNSGAALAPMVVLPIMEKYGMRTGYLTCYGIFTVFVIPQAVAPNFSTLIGCRFIAGCCGGVLQDVMDGIIADIWEGPEQRSLPVTIYVFSLLVGVTLGPVMGGAIVSALYWRWIIYIQLIIYGASFVLIYAFLKETRMAPVSTTTEMNGHENMEEDNTYDRSTWESVIKFAYEAVALPSYLLCTEPVVFFFTFLSALSYGLVFISTQSVTQVYTTLYEWQEYQAGLVQASLAIGEMVGFLACLFQNKLYMSKASSTNAPSQSLETSVAESRLYLSIPGSFIGLTGGLFWYGWTSYAGLPWILPSIGLAFIGFGTMTVMQAIMMYITDAYERYAASASAAVCFGENVLAAFLPLAASSLYTNLGYQWASSLLAFVALAMSFVPVVLILKGREIRKRSPYMRRAAYN